MCVVFFAEKDLRIAYTCVSSLMTPQEASSLLDLHLLVVQLENWDIYKMAELDWFPGHRMEERGVRKQGGVLRSTPGLRSTPLLDTHSQTSLSTSSRGNPRCHFEVRTTSWGGQGKFIWTDPQPLDFDRRSKSASYAPFRPFHRPQRNTIMMSSQIAFNLSPPQTTL